jgi:hypothetical protein
MMSSGAPSPSSFSLSPPAAPDASAYTFRACHTYNRSWNGTASSARNDFLQHAYEVGIESTLATTYRIIFGALYFAIVFWGAHQFILHGRRRRLWCDNRQIVIQSLMWCSLLRGVQFLLKVVTDCNEGLKAMDELFTALETVFQFLAFVLLIAFWIELQIGMKKGLQNLRKTRNPVIAFSITFSTLRMIEFVFIVLAKSPNSFPAAGISLFENIALAFRVLSMLVYAGIMAVAGHWGIKLLRSLRTIEDKSRESQMPQRMGNSRTSSGFPSVRGSTASGSARGSARGSTDMTGAGGTRSGVDAAERGLGLGWTVRGTMSATAKSTKNMIKRMRRASTAVSSGRVDSAKTRLFRQKVVRMTLFMLLEVLTVIVWLVFYGILFTMRGTKGSEAAKVANPQSYLIFKYFEKLCEWMTIVVLCGTMIVGSRTKTAKDAAVSRGVGLRNKPSGGGIGSTAPRSSGAGARSKNATKTGSTGRAVPSPSERTVAAARLTSSSGGGANDAAAASSTAVSVGIVEEKQDHDDPGTRNRGASWNNADSFNVLGDSAAGAAESSGLPKVTKKQEGLTKKKKTKNKAGVMKKKNRSSVRKKDARKKSFPPDAQVVQNPAMAHRV